MLSTSAEARIFDVRCARVRGCSLHLVEAVIGLIELLLIGHDQFDILRLIPALV